METINIYFESGIFKRLFFFAAAVIVKSAGVKLPRAEAKHFFEFFP
jgi:hypothetical protein